MSIFLQNHHRDDRGKLGYCLFFKMMFFFCGGLNFHLIMSGFLVSKDAMAVIFKDNVIQLMTLSTFEDVKNTNYSKYFAQENRETPLRFNLKVHRTSFL